MWENRGSYNGLSVLPHDGGTYTQAPFEDCSKETYEASLDVFSFNKTISRRHDYSEVVYTD